MHDFLEGVCHYDLCSVLYQFVCVNKYFSIDTLNERVQYFNYGPDSGNKPSIITLNHIKKLKLKMNASEMLFFCQHLGLMIGDLIPEDDDTWKLYHLLNEILSIILDTVVDDSSTDYLCALISEHHELYLQVSGTTLKPKHHHMVHHPLVRKTIGPLIHVWTMRLEGKHRPVIKQPSKNTTSRKQLPLTIAKKYCLNLSTRFFCKMGFRLEFSTTSEELRLIDCDNDLNFRHVLFPHHENFIVVKEAKISGTYYKSGCILPLIYKNNLP